MTLKNLRFLTDARWSIKISTKTWLLIIFYVGTYAKNKKYQVPVSARLVYPNLFNDSHDKSVSQYTCARYLKIHENSKLRCSRAARVILPRFELYREFLPLTV